MEVSGKLHAPAVLTAGKRTCYPLNTRLSGPQSLSGSGDERNSQPLPGLELSTIQPGSYLTFINKVLLCLYLII